MARPLSLLKAFLIPTAVIFGIIGTILILYGGIQLFKLDGNQVRRAGLTKELALFTDCDYRSQYTANVTRGAGGGAGGAAAPGAGGNMTATESREEDRLGTGQAFKGAVSNYCEAQQRPYLWYFCLTAVMVFLANMVSLSLGWKAPRSIVYFLAIHLAVTLAMLFTAVYVMMLVTTNLHHIQDCSGFDQTTIQALARADIRCYNTGHGEGEGNRLASFIFDNVLTCFWIGIAFSIFSIGLLSLLLSGVMHAKAHTAYGGGPGWPRDTTHATSYTGAPPATRTDPYLYEDRSRTSSQPPAV